jgi:putative FmdB family regulatory protein
MPNYDYRCDNCGFEQEISQSINAEAISICPNCGKETFHRIITGGAGVLYKGEGWYVTDYSKKSSGGKDTSTLPSPKIESKPATDTPSKAATPKKAD